MVKQNKRSNNNGKPTKVAGLFKVVFVCFFCTAFVYQNQHRSNLSMPTISTLVGATLDLATTITTETAVIETTQDNNDNGGAVPVDEIDDETGGGIFFCGYENKILASELFPDYIQRFAGGLDQASHNAVVDFGYPKRLPESGDILIMGMHGPCTAHIQHFPGKVLFTNGEPNGEQAPKRIKLIGRKNVGDDVYQIGLMGDTDHSIMAFHGAWNMMRLDESIWSTLWDHSRKPINSGKYKGLMYMNGQCHQHREDAVNRMSTIMPIYHGGACRGKAKQEPQNPSFQRMPTIPKGRHWTGNREAYSEYRFCMAMENSLTHHYMSEKIIMAFLSGCIPIYYGSDEIFDVFNREAFVFYNPQNPTPALEKLQMLARNTTAYHDMLHNQPILAHGEDSVRDYFSFSDRIGGGFLKNKLRKVMGLPS